VSAISPGLFSTPWAEFPTKSQQDSMHSHQILQTVSAKSKANHSFGLEIGILLTKLSFSHFIELIKEADPIKRQFYEIQAVQNNLSVRELKREMDSLLYERIGLSTNKESLLQKIKHNELFKPADIIKSPYVLEFLGLQEKPEYSESDLEQALIEHLQSFLMELGRGFCFEFRQKRITFDNTHYYIDLVFYHRILKCHVLVDLKLGAFSHADAGQMNVYLNYFNEQEKTEGDNPPIGIILCASKNESLVKYATTGLSQEVFVAKYQVVLPTEKELKELIEADTKAFQERDKTL
jgi:predicted nuclease of restriction endonuclease-like (RecB) superfamily